MDEAGMGIGRTKSSERWKETDEGHTCFRHKLGKNRGPPLHLTWVGSLRTDGIYLISGFLFISLKTPLGVSYPFYLPISQSVDSCSMSCSMTLNSSQAQTLGTRRERQDEREYGRIKTNKCSSPLENHHRPTMVEKSAVVVFDKTEQP